MIFHDHQTIFFHIGKTAGTSVERLLGHEYDANNSSLYETFYGLDPRYNFYLQHATPEFIKSKIDPVIFSSYFKFSVVRNPYIRSLSVFHYLIDQHTRQFGNFSNYILSLPDLIQRDAEKNGSHHLPQTSYTHINGECVCDYIAHFEDLPSSLDVVRKRLGIPQALGTHNNQRYHDWGTKPPERYYTKEMVELFTDIYKDDFENFGYSKDIRYLDPTAEYSS